MQIQFTSITELIKFDRELRQNKKYETDVCTLDNLKIKKSWDFSLPTIVNNGNVFTYQQSQKMSLKSFKEQFYKNHPFLKTITWDNIMIAGGYVGSVLRPSRYKPNDVDIFIYADSDVEATTIVRRFVSEYVKFLQKQQITKTCKQCSNKKSNNCVYCQQNYKSVEEDKLNINYIRNKYTLNIDDYQIIFRRYSSKSEILHGFDVGSSAVGFDGNQVYFTSLSRFAYEFGYNIIDNTRRSPTYETRLKKYYQRGFGIIMPEFDMSKLDDHLYKKYKISNVCELPFMCMSFRTISKNTIVIDHSNIHCSSSAVSDYFDDMIDINPDECNEYVMFYKNLYKVLHNRLDEMVFVSNMSEDVLDPEFTFMKHKLDYFYRGIYNKIVYYNEFPTSTVSKYIKVDSLVKIFENRKNKDYVKKCIDHQKNVIMTTLQNKISNNIIWKTQNPGEQLTSSFNPDPLDPVQWYGDYFIKRI